MALRVQWKPFKSGLDLLSEPHLSYLKSRMSAGDTTLFPRLYFSYNTGTQQTTIMTTDLNQLYLRMVQRLEALPETANQPGCPEQMVHLLTQCFSVVRECFVDVAVRWDNRANSGVCCDAPLIYTCIDELTLFRQEMISKTLNPSDELNHRVLSVEYDAGVLDRTRGDFMAFQAALTSLERHLQDLWSTLNLRPTLDESCSALFTEQRELCEVTRCLFDSLLSRYDRYLTLV